MWYPFFIIGGVWFWSLLVLELIILTWFTEKEWFGGSLASLIGLIAVIHLFGDASIFTYVRNNPMVVIKYAGLYAVCGFIWSLFKFYFSSRHMRDRINELKLSYVADHTPMYAKREDREAQSEKDWDNYLRQHLGYELAKKLEFSHYSSRIINWMTYWPVSALWTLLDDPIKRFYTWVYDTFLIGVYHKIYELSIGRARQL